MQEENEMSVVNELLRTETDGTISFGNHKLSSKSKLDNFEYQGDLYKVKTYNEITKLEKNGKFIYESVPGTSVNGLKVTETGMKFTVEGTESAQITLELEDEKEYEVVIDGANVGTMATNMSGKLNLSVEFDDAKAVTVEILKR